MKERPLNFHRNDDPTIVECDSEKLKKAKDFLKKSHLNVAFCLEQYEKGTLTQGMLETHLSLAESYTKDFTDLFDYEGVLKKENDERYAEIRGLNQENRDLRKQIGLKISNDDLRERCKIIRDSVAEYFRSIGLFLTDDSFSGYGSFQGRVSCAIMNHEKKGIEVLKSKGIELDYSDGIGIIANDKNKDILKEMILEKYPSCNIHEVLEWHSARRESCQIKDIKIIITNLDDIEIQKGDS